MIVPKTDLVNLSLIMSSILFNSRWILQLINVIHNDLPNLLKYFNETSIFVIFFAKLFPLLSSSAFPSRVALYLNDWEIKVLLLVLVIAQFWVQLMINLMSA